MFNPFTRDHGCGASACLAVLLLLASPPAEAGKRPPASDRIVFQFNGSNGRGPGTGNLLAVQGALYGTTYLGGTVPGCDNFGCGTIYRVLPNGRQTVLHSFGGTDVNGTPDGALPNALVLYNNVFYGTTSEGGVGGYGTVFSITPFGLEKVLYSFKGGADGATPQAALVNVGGTLYGTTQQGGASGHGTVFSVTPKGVENVVYSFQGAPDGDGPIDPLINVNGTLYGTTQDGGTNNYGTVFSVTAGRGRDGASSIPKWKQ